MRTELASAVAVMVGVVLAAMTGVLFAAEMPGGGAAAQTTSTVYRVVEGRAVFPAYDGSQTSATAARLTMVQKDFPESKPFRDQLLLVVDPIVSAPFRVEESDTTISVMARSRGAGDVFPRVRISLVSDDNNHHRVFEGYWQTISLETLEWPISQWVKGREVRLKLEMLNPGLSDEQRTFYFQRAEVR